MTKGIIFDIKRYAIHDGPGIRTTVFFKGCALQCPWCHNPEGVQSKPEVMLHSERCAEECEECISSCTENAISKNDTSIVIDQEKCNLCGKCDEVCVREALQIVGQERTVHELVEEIEKDRIFFDESGGGVTISGGEPLEQPDFLKALLKEIKRRKIHVALDICGFAPSDVVERIHDIADLFLYDLKIMDDEKHREHTGVSNRIILENLRKLSEKGKRLDIRIPLISGINDDDRNIKMMVDYLRSLKNIKRINLLPYHRGGKEKHRRLRKDRDMNAFQPPSRERLAEIQKILVDSGFLVKVGG